MKSSGLHLIGVDYENSLIYVKQHDAARRPDSKKRQRTRGTLRPQCGLTCAVANTVADDLWRQDCGGIQSTCLAIARRTGRAGATGRAGPGRDSAHRRSCRAKPGGETASVCIVSCADSRRSGDPKHPYGQRSGVAKTAVSGVRTRGLRLGAAQRDAASQSRARDVCDGAFSATRAGRDRHRQVQRRTCKARVFATREFSARSVTYLRTRLRGRARLACDNKSTSANVLRWMVLTTTLLLCPSSSDSCLSSSKPFRQDVATV